MEEYVRQVNTNIELSQEIERLNNDIKELFKENSNKEKVIRKQEKIIDKAIEYGEKYLPNYDFDHTNLQRLLEILKGSDKE